MLGSACMNANHSQFVFQRGWETSNRSGLLACLASTVPTGFPTIEQVLKKGLAPMGSLQYLKPLRLPILRHGHTSKGAHYMNSPRLCNQKLLKIRAGAVGKMECGDLRPMSQVTDLTIPLRRQRTIAAGRHENLNGSKLVRN